MRLKRKISTGDLLVWARNPETGKKEICIYDRTMANRSPVPVKLTSRGPWKRLMQRIARFFDRLAY